MFNLTQANLMNYWHGSLVPGWDTRPLGWLELFSKHEIFFSKCKFTLWNLILEVSDQFFFRRIPRILEKKVWAETSKIKFHKVKLHFEKKISSFGKSSSHPSGRVSHPGTSDPWSCGISRSNFRKMMIRVLRIILLFSLSVSLLSISVR